MRRCEAISTLGFGVLAGLSSQPVRAQGTREKIQVAGPPAEDMTDLYYAIKTGMFGRAELDVEMVATSNGAAATTAVITGTYPIARTSMLVILSAHLRGIPVTIVAPSIINAISHPNGELQIASDAAYKSGADLNGKTMGSAGLDDLNTLAIKAWVDKTGGDSSTLRFVEIPNVAMEAAIVAHRVDAAIMQSPQLDASLADGACRTLAYAYGAIAPNFMGAAYVARSDWASQHADAVRRFVRVLTEAAGYVNTHPAETAPLVAEVTKIEIGSAQKMFRTMNGTILDPALVQPVIDVAAKYKLISRAFPAGELFWH